MKKAAVIFLLVVLTIACFSPAFAQEKKKIILLIAEQNIEGPQKAWWASEIDLSSSEARLAERLIKEGYEVIEPANLSDTIKKKPAFRLVNLPEDESVALGNLSNADFVVLGKAIASGGGNVPQSNMRSCFANITAKVIDVKANKVIGYLEASGNSAHMDVITGGKEALANAGEDLAERIIQTLNKDGGK